MTFRGQDARRGARAQGSVTWQMTQRATSALNGHEMRAHLMRAADACDACGRCLRPRAPEQLQVADGLCVQDPLEHLQGMHAPNFQR